MPESALTLRRTIEQTSAKTGTHRSKLPFLVFAILFLGVLGVIVYANRDKINWTESLVAKTTKADYDCPFSYRNTTIDLCYDAETANKAPYILMHRFAQVKPTYDDGWFGLQKKNYTHNLDFAMGYFNIAPGANGNYKLRWGLQAQLVGFQTWNTYVGNVKSPSDSDYSATEPLRVFFMNLAATGNLTATVSKTKLITEWKIETDPADANYIRITVPDADTTGADMKKFIGGELAMRYNNESGYNDVLPWMKDQVQTRWYETLVRGPKGVSPSHPNDQTQGQFNHHWVIDAATITS